MKKITDEELKVILENHLHWLNQDCDGWENMRAKFDNVDLENIDLSHEILAHAIFEHSRLYHVYFDSTNLEHAYFHHVDFICCNFYEADLSAACFKFVNLDCANFQSSKLNNAIFKYSNTCGAFMSNADLDGVYFNNSLPHNDDVACAKNIPFIPITCPDTGAFIGWKKCHDNKIVKLEIPEDAKRSSSLGRKCRCDKARVLGIYNIDGTESDDNIARSKFNYYFIYKVGEVVSIPDFDENRWNECSTGIHFFITWQEAVNYDYN